MAEAFSGYVLGTATDPDGNTSELTPCPNGLVFKVESDGDVYADGTYQTPAADFAELWPVSAEADVLAPGDLLALGPDGGVMLAGAVNSGPVVGVYATQPGLLAGGPDALAADFAASVPLALVGVVPVKVSAAESSAAGCYTFTLTVTDTGGLSDSDSAVITVSEQAPGYCVFLPLVLRE